MMYSMMSYAGGMPFFPFFGIGNILVLIGVIFLLAWAIRHLPVEKLKNIGLWCVCIGILISLLAGLILIPFHGQYRRYGTYDQNTRSLRRGMMFQQSNQIAPADQL